MTQKRDVTGAATIESLRRRIERTDDAMLVLLRRRMRLARAIGKAKQVSGTPVLDPAREARVVRRIAASAREHGMPAEEVRSLFWSIIALCRSEQINARTNAAARASE
ncbi:MAG: chorismate mutase [Gemmatimonadetes bacterium]|nr:chorismate mutase [Gemmatimonadota bacterium]